MSVASEISGAFSGPCACIGPAGDCPCIRQQKGLPQRITETYVAPHIWDLIPDEDKKLINEIKTRAAMGAIFGWDKEKPNANT